MDRETIYILLLLAITITCIGVSAGIKYEKSDNSTTGHPFHVEYDDNTHEPISSDQDKVNQTRSIQNISPEYLAAQGKLASGSKKTTSSDTSTVPSMKIDTIQEGTTESSAQGDVTENIIIYTDGNETQQNLNNNTMSKNYITPTQTTNGKFLAGYSVGPPFFQLEDTIAANSDSAQIMTFSTDYVYSRLKDGDSLKNISYYNTGTLAYGPSNSDNGAILTVVDGMLVVKFGGDTPAQFLSASGTGTNIKITTILPSDLKNGDVIFKAFQSPHKPLFSDATSDGIIFRAFTYKTDGTKNLVDLSFFGITSASNYPRAFDVSQYFEDTRPNTVNFDKLNDIPQYLSNYLQDNGMFAILKTSSVPSAYPVNGSGFTSASVEGTAYNVQICNASHITNGSNTTLKPTVTSSPAASGDPFYHIHIIDVKSISNGTTFTITDGNTIKQTQTVVLFINSIKTNHGFDYLARDDGNINNKLTIDSTNIENDFYENQGSVHYDAMIFFSMCLEENLSTGDSVTLACQDGYVLYNRVNGSSTVVDYSGKQFINPNKNIYFKDGDDVITRYHSSINGGTVTYTPDM